MKRSVLVLRPPVERERLRELFAGWGFASAGAHSRGEREFHEEQLADADGNTLLYREDHILGQWLLLASGPAEEALCAELVSSLPVLSLGDAQQAAEAADSVQARIVALGPLVAHFVEGREVDERTFNILASWIGAPELALRRATLVGAAYLYSPLVDELLEAALADPALRPEAERQLALRRELGRPGERSIERGELWAQAQVAWRGGQLWAGLIYGRAALALARREGVRLHEMLGLCTEIEAELRTSAASAVSWDSDVDAASADALAGLQVLLDERRFYEVEEVATALLELSDARLPLRMAVNLLDLLAGALRGRGRGDLAAPQAGRAVALLDELLGREPGLTEAWLARARLAAKSSNPGD